MKIILFILFTALSANSYSQDSLEIVKKPSSFGVALGVSASTNGLGASVITALNKHFALRLSYETLDNKMIQNIYPINTPIDFTMDGQDLAVTPQIKFGGFSGILDYYLAKSFYISVGAVYTDYDVTINSKIKDFTINKVTLVDQGGLSLSVKPAHKLSPYAAIGIGRNISRNHRFTMNFEIGAYHMGSYVLSMNGTGLLDGNNTESLKELNETLKNISWSGIFPILKFGLSYKIWKK